MNTSKRKGTQFERDLVNQAMDSGLPAKLAAYGSNGEALGESPEVDLIVGGVRIQAKRRKAVAAYLQIPDGCDAVVFRQDFGEPLVLPYAALLDLLKGPNATQSDFPLPIGQRGNTDTDADAVIIRRPTLKEHSQR